MKLTFIYNACSILEQDGCRLLTDPWLTPGAFEGSWFHAPALTTTPASVADVDYLYLSHLHPDHFDPVTLAAFRRDIPIVVLDHGANFLARMLGDMGFTQLVRVRDGETVERGRFRLTLFAPFTSHVFHERALGNLIDSALLVEAGGHSVLNTNDNTLTEEAATALRRRFGSVTVAQLNYNAAGPYPACFTNLGRSDKRHEHKRLLERNISHLVEVARALAPHWVMPFAGSYVLGGALHEKNQFLGTTTWDDAATRIEALAPELRTLVMHEGLVLDLTTGEFVNGPYRPIDNVAQATFIAGDLAQRKYPHEFTVSDDEAQTLTDWVGCWLPEARLNLWRMQQKLSCFRDYNFYLRVPDRVAAFGFDRPELTFLSERSDGVEPFLAASLDVRLLARILAGAAHWNNAEIGCHIEFRREPNRYEADVHTLMSFLHIPRGRRTMALDDLQARLRDLVSRPTHEMPVPHAEITLPRRKTAA